LLNINQNQNQKKVVSVSLASKCKCCGRPLKAHSSQVLGFGLTCAIKEGLIKPKVKPHKEDHSIDLYTLVQ